MFARHHDTAARAAKSLRDFDVTHAPLRSPDDKSNGNAPRPRPTYAVENAQADDDRKSKGSAPSFRHTVVPHQTPNRCRAKSNGDALSFRREKCIA